MSSLACDRLNMQTCVEYAFTNHAAGYTDDVSKVLARLEERSIASLRYMSALKPPWWPVHLKLEEPRCILISLQATGRLTYRSTPDP